MAFNKKTWLDRLTEFATRRTLTDQNSGTVSVVEVTRTEGTVYQQGDAFSAENMNDLEDRIFTAFVGTTAIEACTDEEYDELTEEQKMDGTARVVGSIDTDDMMTAAVVEYDNIDSGLDAENVQAAIDEINSDLTELKITPIEVTGGANLLAALNDISESAMLYRTIVALGSGTNYSFVLRLQDYKPNSVYYFRWIDVTLTGTNLKGDVKILLYNRASNTITGQLKSGVYNSMAQSTWDLTNQKFLII